MSKVYRMLRFRCRQCFRLLQNIGWIYLVLLLPLLFIGSLAMLEPLLRAPNPLYVLPIYGLIVLLVHSSRNDFGFLQKIRMPKTYLFIGEYQLLVLPFSLLLLLVGRFWGVLWGHAFVLLLTLILGQLQWSARFKASNWPLRFIPNDLFEWKGSIRKSPVLFALLWMSGFAVLFHPFAYFVFLLFFTPLISVHFKPIEGKMLQPMSSKDLHRKTWRNSIFLNLLLLPHWLVFLVAHPTSGYLILSICLYLLLVQLYCIYFKYSVYQEYGLVYNDVPTLIFMLLCPFLPFSLLLLWRTYYKAKKRIEYAAN